MLLETDRVADVQQAITELEPGAAIEEISNAATRHNSSTPSDMSKKDAWLLGGVAVVFAIGLVFDPQLILLWHGLGRFAVFIPLYIVCGGTVLLKAARNIGRGQIFDENFLMSLATIGAILIGELPEAVGVMLFYQIGEFLQNRAVQRSRRSITALLAIRPDYAHLQMGREVKTVAPELVGVDDVILIKPGEKIPLDGIILEGDSQVDTAALTGEATPRRVQPDSTVLAGFINKTGLLRVRVSKTFGESSIAKVLDLVENATAQKARTEQFITQFARYYTPAVVVLATGVALLPPLITGASLSVWIYRALTLLVISCPCALVISIPLSYFGGIGGASRRGILIKGSNFLDVLANVTTVVFDKTGTLTQGVFDVVKVEPHGGFAQDDLLDLSAHAESHSNHPIAQSIRAAYGQKTDDARVSEHHEIEGRGILSQVDSRPVLAGNDQLLHDRQIDHSAEVCGIAGTVVHLAINQNYAGHLIVSDRLKADASLAIQALKAQGVTDLVMLTGDRQNVAQDVAQKLGIERHHAELLPEDKLRILEELLRAPSRRGKVAFVGDGVNDAPALARADVGIAMGALGADAAIETADVVIMDDSPAKIAEAIQIGKKTRKVVWQNIAFALGVKGLFIGLGAFGLASMWEAVFADVGVTLLAVLNALRTMHSTAH